MVSFNQEEEEDDEPGSPGGSQIEDDAQDSGSEKGSVGGGENRIIDASAIIEVQDKTFEEVKLPDAVVDEVQTTWASFISGASSREAAGEALYNSIFESAPSLQALFKSPRAVAALRIMNGLNSIVGGMKVPGQLKTTVETIGFQHLDLEVTAPRVSIFRDAIVDLLEMELGDKMTSLAKSGWRSILNYVGGAFIYIRVHFTQRLRIISTSWATANNKKQEPEEIGEKDGQEEETSPDEDREANKNIEEQVGDIDVYSEVQEVPDDMKRTGLQVPTTFDEMFMFNGAVMGFVNTPWMDEILESFDNIVTNVSNPYRLQEECDTLGLRISMHNGPVNLNEFKSIMLASLRSLVPKDWNSDHEVAWTWLWSNVERFLKAVIGKPKLQERALRAFILNLREDDQNFLRSELYKAFFLLAPAGQDFFKQSTTRLYWIADKVIEMTLEMYGDPKRLVEVISAVGLRHVGYGTPTELFAPYVTGACETVKKMTTDETAQEAFRWSLGLIARILTRTITEGSTIVMQAINTNSAKQLKRAISCAPRGKRAIWMLNITVGTQSISPLYWSIESGSLEAANAMLQDLLIIRADRENYYYGCNDLFERHRDVIKRLCADAEELLPTLLDGLIWRSRVQMHGLRRVNYYIKHLVTDAEEHFCQALEWLVEAGNPKTVCHPVVVLFSDLLWDGVAYKYFLLARCWVLFSLAVFITGEAALKVRGGEPDGSQRVAIFCCRLFIYLSNMSMIAFNQVKKLVHDIRLRDFTWVGPVAIPHYLSDFKERVGLLLAIALIIMLCLEPMFRCVGNGDGLDRFTELCPEGSSVRRAYSTASMVAMLLYWLLISDLTILSTRISAFVYVCGRVLPEVGLFLFALAFLIASFATSISALDFEGQVFTGIDRAALALLRIGFSVFPESDYAEVEHEAVLMVFVLLFVIIITVFLLNLLIAQLDGAYRALYADMVGYARLNRGKIICETMVSVSSKQWANFLEALRFEERLEFNEGDIGIAGGIQVLEAANANPTTVDMIKRYGGSTSPAMQWPADAADDEFGDDDDSRFDRMEKFLARAAKGPTGGAAGGAQKGRKSTFQRGADESSVAGYGSSVDEDE